MSENEFTAQVIRYAHLLGWRVAHFRPGRTARGWRTPVEGDGAGFPDLVLVKGRRLIVAELKVAGRKPTPAQLAWARSFEDAGVSYHLWTPERWPDIEALLQGLT
jgi:hypothetical protein